ncbi:hypothetical protein ACN47E_009709 [Coniothyrium glycines]
MGTMREHAAMSGLPDGHQRAQHEYTYRLPTPPRITVPPPTLSIDLPGLTVAGSGAEEVDTSFLQELDLEGIVQKNTLLEWAYERRRQAQMILPWLYLGPMVAAKDKTFLQREGITMVLAIRAQANSMVGALQAASGVCLDVSTVEAATPHNLIGKFGETTNMINQHVARVRQRSLQTTGHPALGKVLVFCESGNEKSAAVAAAYLMDTLTQFDYVKAMQVCQAQRFCVNFDDTIKNILRSRWDIVQARRAVAATARDNQPQGSLSIPSKHKRGIERTRDDDDMDMEDAMEESDALRFVGRDVTPFGDS